MQGLGQILMLGNHYAGRHPDMTAHEIEALMIVNQPMAENQLGILMLEILTLGILMQEKLLEGLLQETLTPHETGTSTLGKEILILEKLQYEKLITLGGSLTPPILHIGIFKFVVPKK